MQGTNVDGLQFSYNEVNGKLGRRPRGFMETPIKDLEG